MLILFLAFGTIYLIIAFFMLIPYDDTSYPVPPLVALFWLPSLISDHLNTRIRKIRRRMQNADEHLRLAENQCTVPLDDDDWETFHWRIIQDLIRSARNWLKE